MDDTIKKINREHQQHLEAEIGDYAMYAKDYNKMALYLEFYKVLYSHLSPIIQHGLLAPDNLQPDFSLPEILESYFHAHEEL